MLGHPASEIIKFNGWEKVSYSMTADDFRRMALSFPETEERAHMNHPDFRVRGDLRDAQLSGQRMGDGEALAGAAAELPGRRPGRLRARRGAWGRGGATMVRLKAAKKTLTRKALETAWQAQQPRNKNAS